MDKTNNKTIMNTKLDTANIIYANKYTNVCYTDGEILELIRRKRDNESIKDVIFDLYAKFITRCIEQYHIYKFLTYEESQISVAKLCKILGERYNKSDRTYRRSIDNLVKAKIIFVDKGIISLNIDYDLSLLDLNDTKSLIIHIN